MAGYDIEKILAEQDIITVKEALSIGMNKPELYSKLEEMNYKRVAHGVYAAEDNWVDDMLLLHLRCPNAVFSHDEALYYHGLIDREPVQQTITVYSGYNTKRLTSDGIKVYTVKKELVDVGKVIARNNAGNEVPIYNLERTICDLVRNRSNFEIQDFQTALKAYVRRSDKDINRLMQYAKLFRVDRIIRQYMEVML